MPRLEIRMLGPFEVTRNGEPVTAFETDSARALLAYLASDPGHTRSRPVVAEMLWPERRHGAALSNLRHVLSVLRRTLANPDTGETALVTDRSTMSLDPSSDIWIDIVEFERLAAVPEGTDDDVESWSRATDLWRGPLLEGLTVRAGAEWEEWVVITGERVRRQYAAVLARLADHLERNGAWDRAIPVARELVDIDPWDERAHRRLMRLVSRSGRNAEALSHFARLEEHFAREFATEPESRTIALAEQIRAGDLETVADSDLAYPAFLSTEPASSPSVFVARRAELAELQHHLDDAIAGRGHVVLLAGEAGSGKTMLAREFMHRAIEIPGVLVAAGNCSTFGGHGDPYLPFREVLGLLCGNVESGYTAGVLDHEQATRLWEAIPHAARLVSDLAPSLLGVMVNGALLADRVEQALPGVEWVGELRHRVEEQGRRTGNPERLQPALFDDYTAVLERLSITRPLLIVIDDLQWADRGSLALLWHLARRLEGMRVLVVVSYRPETSPDAMSDGHSFLDVVHDLEARDPNCTIELANSRGFIDEYLDSEPNALGRSFRDRLFSYTAGHPLFTVEMVRGMQERGELRRDRTGVWRAREPLDWDRLPSRVEAVIAQRMSRVPDDLLRDLQAASVQGQDFIAEIVADVRADPEACARLGSAGLAPHQLVDPAGVDRVGGAVLARHRFRHVLFQRYLYDRLDPAARVRIHEGTGRALEERYRNETDMPIVDLARHFEEANLPEPAIEYLHQAGRRAVRMAASEEAISLLERALSLVESLPDSRERDERELAILASLAAPVMTIRGYAAPEAEAIGDRVLALRERVDPSPTVVLALTGMATVLSLRGRYAAAAALTEEALDLGASMHGPPGVTLNALQVLGYDLTWMGDLVGGHEVLERAHRAFDRESHAWLTDATGSSPGPAALVWDAINTLHRGYPDRAKQLADEGIALARDLGHSFTLCHALAVGGSVLRSMAGEFEAALPFIDEFTAIAAEEHFPFYAAAAMIHRGQVLGYLSDPEGGITAITSGLDAWADSGILAFRGPFLGDVGEFHHRLGHTDRGLEVIAGALEDARAAGEQLTELPLLVQRGAILASRGAAEASTALGEVALRAGASGMRLLELRALTHLAASFDPPRDAADSLERAYVWFDEGLDTPYLEAARMVLSGS